MLSQGSLSILHSLVWFWCHLPRVVQGGFVFPVWSKVAPSFPEWSITSGRKGRTMKEDRTKEQQKWKGSLV